MGKFRGILLIILGFVLIWFRYEIFVFAPILNEWPYLYSIWFILAFVIGAFGVWDLMRPSRPRIPAYR